MKKLTIARLTIDELETAQSSVELFWDKRPDRETIVKFLQNPQNLLLSAELDCVLVGQAIGQSPHFVNGYILDRWDRPEPMLFLYSIDVAEPHQRQGIGKALIEKFKQIGREYGCDEAFVPTNKSNLAAMQLYRSTGGKVTQPDDVVIFEYNEL